MPNLFHNQHLMGHQDWGGGDGKIAFEKGRFFCKETEKILFKKLRIFYCTKRQTWLLVTILVVFHRPNIHFWRRGFCASGWAGGTLVAGQPCMSQQTHVKSSLAEWVPQWGGAAWALSLPARTEPHCQRSQPKILSQCLWQALAGRWSCMLRFLVYFCLDNEKSLVTAFQQPKLRNCSRF